MKKYLVLGGSGYLGTRFMKILTNSFGTYYGTTNSQSQNLYYFNGANASEFESMLKSINPDAVINCIGFTNVDLCDKLPEKSWGLNVWYPRNYAEICKKYNVKFVQISTDHYENKTKLKLQENDLCEPINCYGFSKLYAESLILKVNPQALIVRSNFFHFNFRKPFTFLDHLLLKTKNKINTLSFKDVIFTPISTNKLLECICDLIDLNYFGLINVCGKNELSKFEFHDAVLKALNIDSSSHNSSSIDQNRLSAKRPQYMALDNTLFESTVGYKLPTIYDMIREEILFAEKELNFNVK